MRKKIVVLGGGVGAMSAVFGLTSKPGWQDDYEITVYQTGWRLGGKGASGRNRALGDRIEEHGLHIWMGFYENAFRMMRDCYEELGRPADAPLATWQDAFKPHSLIVHQEWIAGQWRTHEHYFTPNSALPGDGDTLPSPLEYAEMLAHAAMEFYRRALGVPSRAERPSRLHDTFLAGLSKVRSFTDRAGIKMLTAMMERAAEGAGLNRAAAWLSIVEEALSALSGLSIDRLSIQLEVASLVLARFYHVVSTEMPKHLEESDEARRFWIALDLSLTNLRGMIADGLLLPGRDFTDVDDEDYKDWIKRHGAATATIESAAVRALYDLVFSRGYGIAAGATLICSLRMLFTYKGSLFYAMQAGMGDVVFAPLYEVLKRRGVKFRFFHQVTGLRVDASGTSVGRIEIGRQVTLNGSEYEPLYDVKGLPCWPSEPLWEQIREADEIKQGGHNLESAYSRWKHREAISLEKGRDFDMVVFGISIAAMPQLCAELLVRDRGLADMVAHTMTVKTQAMQLWLTPSLSEVGWKAPPPVQTAYEGPFDTWADMSHLLSRESWPEDGPRQIAYFCSSLSEGRATPAGRRDDEYPDAERLRVRNEAKIWLKKNIGHLWPNAVKDGEFRWELLHAPAGVEGEARLDAQFIEANINPSDRYVQSVPGSLRYRLSADGTRFDNFVMAGDYVRTRLNGGCVEAAVMGGLQASRAICGSPRKIIGDYPSTRLSSLLPRQKESASRLPPYIERGGGMVYRAPLRLDGCTMYAFMLGARFEALESMCDRYLNQPMGKMHYRPLGPWCVFVAADVRSGYSTHPQDRLMGVYPEKDIAFWIPLVAGEKRQGRFVADRLVWFMPYVWVDNFAAAATGREVFGFHKQLGTIRIADPRTHDRPISVDALALEKRGRENSAKYAPIVSVRRLQGDGAASLFTGDMSAMRLLHHTRKLAAGNTRDGLTKWSMAFARSLDSTLRKGQTRIVFLQQLRDPEDGNRASFQAIIEADATSLSRRGGGPLPGKYSVDLEPLDSHPIAADLGLTGLSNPVKTAFWLDFDFTMDPGKVIWARGRSVQD